MDITVEDFKELTFQLFVAQKQIAALEAKIAELTKPQEANDDARSDPEEV